MSFDESIHVPLRMILLAFMITWHRFQDPQNDFNTPRLPFRYQDSLSLTSGIRMSGHTKLVINSKLTHGLSVWLSASDPFSLLLFV